MTSSSQKAMEESADKYVFESPKHSGYPEHVVTYKAGWCEGQSHLTKSLLEGAEEFDEHKFKEEFGLGYAPVINWTRKQFVQFRDENVRLRERNKYLEDRFDHVFISELEKEIAKLRELLGECVREFQAWIDYAVLHNGSMSLSLATSPLIKEIQAAIGDNNKEK